MAHSCSTFRVLLVGPSVPVNVHTVSTNVISSVHNKDTLAVHIATDAMTRTRILVGIRLNQPRPGTPVPSPWGMIASESSDSGPSSCLRLLAMFREPEAIPSPPAPRSLTPDYVMHRRLPRSYKSPQWPRSDPQPSPRPRPHLIDPTSLTHSIHDRPNRRPVISRP